MIREEKGRLVGETVSTGLNTLELLKKNGLYPYRGIPANAFIRTSPRSAIVTTIAIKT